MPEETEITERMKREVIDELSTRSNLSEIVATYGSRNYTVVDMVNEIDNNTLTGQAYVAVQYED
jgi:hypothetical protein